MSDAAVEEPATEQPVVYRLGIAIQRLGRLRDTFSRDRTPEGKLAAASEMARAADEVHRLTAGVLDEAEGLADIAGPDPASCAGGESIRDAAAATS